MNYEEMLKRILNGESTEDIAKAITNDLNKATAEAKRLQEEQAKKNSKEAELNACAETLINDLYDYMKLAGVELNETLGVAEVRKVLDKFVPIFQKFENVKIEVSAEEPKKCEKKATATSTSRKNVHLKSADDIFNWFFDTMGF